MGVSNQSTTILQNFIRDQGITFPVLQDGNNTYFAYNIPGGQSPYPRDYIIKDQTIHFADTEYDPGAMIRVIESLLGNVPTGVNDSPEAVPATFSLASVYPNPFNATVTIRVDNPYGQAVELAVYDLNGRWLEEIYAGWLGPGAHQFRWRAEGRDAVTLNSGVYLLRLRGETDSITRKLVLLK